MTQAVQIFNHPEFGDVRVIGDFDNPRFCLADLCKALEVGNPSDVKKRLDKGVVSIDTLQTAGGMQSLLFVNEDGLYDVILESRKPNARKMRKWITAEVVPSIRKTGMYINPAAPIDPEFLRRIADEIDRRNKKITVLETQLAEAKPKVDYCDLILQCPDLVTTSAIAKDYGMSAKKFNQLLRELGVQFYQSGMWLLYQKYAGRGWSQTKTYTYVDEYGKPHCKVHTYWTQKGRLGLYDVLKTNDTLPTIEKEAIA